MKTAHKIDFFLPQTSQYGVLHHFTKKMSESFAKRGFACRLFSAEDQKATIQDPPDITLSFNGAPEHASGIFLCDLIEKPHISCLVDLAYRYQHLIESRFIHIGCNDAFSERMFRDNGCDRAFFLPVAADIPKHDVDHKREYDVVLMTTFIDFEGKRNEWIKRYPEPMVNVLNHSAELMFADENLSLVEAFQTAFNTALQNKEPLMINPTIIKTALSDLELYVRGRDRAELAASIQHLPLHVFDGTIDKIGWKDYLKNSKNVKFHPSVSFEESLDIFSKSKIILNSSPHTRYGASERVFNALATGALPLTNHSPYLSSIFKSEEDILFFANKKLDLVEPLIDKYLKDNDLRTQVINSGQKKVLENHTWDNRVDLLINYIGDKI